MSEKKEGTAQGATQEQPKITSIRLAKQDEIDKMPLAKCRLIHDIQENKKTAVSRDSYYAIIEFDQLTKVRIPLNSDEYGLIVTSTGLAYVKGEIQADIPVRIVGTKWEDGNISYRLDAVLSGDVRKSINIDSKSPFQLLFLKRLEMGVLNDYKPEVRDAAKKKAKK
jgi:hypothetical protein